MGLFSFFARKKALTATPGVLEAASSRQLNTYIPLGGTNLDYGRINSVYVEAQSASFGWMYRYQPSVRTVIEYLARNISQLSLKVFERIEDDERKHRGDHPAAVLLRKPNAHTPGPQLIYELVTDFLIYDNCYGLKLRSPQTGELDNIIRIEPPLVGLIGRTHFSPEGYRIYSTDGSSFDVPPEDMIHWRGYNPTDPRKGESKLETLRELLAADLTARKGVTEIFRSGLMQGGWIERPEDATPLTPEAAERLRQSLTNMGKSSKMQFGLLEEGMKFSNASLTPEDAQYLAARAAAIDEVNAIYGLQNVPPQSEEERKHVYADVLPPYTTVIASFLNLQILQQEFDDDDLYFEFGKEKLMDEIYKTYTSASGRPVLLTDEARSKLDLPPVPGGDELVTPQNVTIGGKPSTGVMPIQDPNKPPQDGSHRTEDVPTPPGKALMWADDSGLHIKNGNGNGRVKEVPLIPRRARTYHRRDNWTPQYGEKFSSHFARQRQAVKSKKAKADVADERWNEELRVDLLEVSRRHLEAEGKHAAFRMASDFDPGQGENWLDAKAIGAAEGINQTTAKHIEEQGVEDAFAHAIEVRAIAAGAGYATDVHGFSWKAAAQQHEGSGAMVTIDGGECEICAEFQGTWPIDEVPGWPGYHNACDCVVDVTPGSKSLAVRETNDQTEIIQVLVKALANGDKSVEFAEAFAKAISNLPTPQVNVAPAETHIHEGAVKSHTTVEAPPPAEVTIAEGAVQVEGPSINVEAPPPAEVTIAEGAVQNQVTVEPAPPAEVNVAPAEVNIQKGAVQNHVKVDAPPPAEVNVAPTEVNVAPAEVRFGKGAINVEAPPPANVNIEEGAIKVEPPTVNVEPAEVKVESPVNVNVDAKSGKQRHTPVRDEKTGHIKHVNVEPIEED